MGKCKYNQKTDLDKLKTTNKTFNKELIMRINIK